MDDATKQLIQLRKQLKEDIENYQYNLGLCMGQEIAKELTEEAHSAIKEFYEYKPKRYTRHWNFWKSYRKVHTYRNGERTAGVELLLEEFPDDYRSSYNYSPTKESSSSVYFGDDPKDVFWRVYGFGWHGLASITHIEKIPELAPLKPTPLRRIISKRNEIIKNSDKYQKRASNMAKKKKYNLLFK